MKKELKRYVVGLLAVMLVAGFGGANVLAMSGEDESAQTSSTTVESQTVSETPQNEAGNASDGVTQDGEQETGEETGGQTAEENGLVIADQPSVIAEEPAGFDGKIYLGGTGDDANDGLTPETPVKTFAKAKALLEANGGDTISVVSTVKVTDDEEWNVGGTATIKMERDPSFTNGSLVQVTNTTLNIEHIVLDGKNEDTTKTMGPVIRADKSDLRLGAGAIVQNGCAQNGGGVMFAGGGSNKLYMDGGAKIQNCNATYAGGGAFVSGGYAILRNGSQITYCHAKQYGGGIHLDDTYLYLMDSAETMIAHCSSGFLGGGVNAMNASRVYLQDGAISNCSAIGHGGGVYLSGIIKQCNLIMSGGCIDGNTAGGCGGGIMASKCLVLISNGKITNNTAELLGGGMELTDGSIGSIRATTGSTNANPGTVEISGNRAKATPAAEGLCLSGGGIYVDGRTDAGNGAVYPISTLYMDDCVISNNTAGIDGGGVALCPTGSSQLHVLDGEAIFANDSANAGNTSVAGSDDVMVIRNGTTTADGTKWNLSENGSTAAISQNMLGGGLYQWKDGNGNPVPVDALADYRGDGLQNEIAPDSPEAQAAMAKATVFVQNNTADGIGGGIACNGLLVCGRAVEMTELSILKKWEDTGFEDKRPEKITVKILQNGEEYGIVEITPNENGEWSKTIGNLPLTDAEGNPYEYTVEEVAVKVEGGMYESTVQPGITADSDAQEPTEFTIVNKFVATHTLQILKIDEEGNALAGAHFVLSTDKAGTQVISEWDSEDTATALDLAAGTYYLTETAAPDGYETLTAPVEIVVAEDGTFTVTGGEEDAEKISYDEESTTLTLKNAKTPETPEEEEPKTPDEEKPTTPGGTTNVNTGDSSNMGLWMALAGTAALAVIVLLVLRRKEQK